MSDAMELDASEVGQKPARCAVCIAMRWGGETTFFYMCELPPDHGGRHMDTSRKVEWATGTAPTASLLNECFPKRRHRDGPMHD